MFVTFFHSPINHQICLKWSPDMDESRCTCTPCLQFLRCQFHMSTNVNASKYNRKTGISDFPCHCQKTNSFFLLNKVDNSSLKTDIIFFIICPSFLKHVAPWSWHQIVRNPGVHVWSVAQTLLDMCTLLCVREKHVTLKLKMLVITACSGLDVKWFCACSHLYCKPTSGKT